MCLRFIKPFSSYLKIRNDWYMWNRTKMVFILYIKSIIIRLNLQFLYKISYSSLWCSPGICSRPSSSQYTSNLYMILLVNFQMYTITFTLIIFNYIPSYPTPSMYYQITQNYVNVHQLSDYNE